MDPLSISGVAKDALGLLPGLVGLFGGRGKPINYRAIIDHYRSLMPTGYLTPEDTAFADTQFQRGAEVVGRKTMSARSAAAGRLAARGLSGSPAAERVLENINQQESRDLTGIERNRQAMLYGIRSKREGYQQQMNLQGLMGELSGARYNAQREDLQRSGFFNSMLEFAPEVFDYFGGLGQPKLGGGMTDTPLQPADEEPNLG